MGAGNLVGLVLSPIILTTFGWRALFYLFGFLGFPLLAFWMAVVPDKKAVETRRAAASSSESERSSTAPAASGTQSPAGSKSEEPGKEGSTTAGSQQAGERGEGGASTSGGDVSALALMSKSATWAIVIVNIVNHFGYFIYLNWMPTYFVKVLFVPL